VSTAATDKAKETEVLVDLYAAMGAVANPFARLLEEFQVQASTLVELYETDPKTKVDVQEALARNTKVAQMAIQAIQDDVHNTLSSVLVKPGYADLGTLVFSITRLTTDANIGKQHADRGFKRIGM
jgi:hypothetical protein